MEDLVRRVKRCYQPYYWAEMSPETEMQLAWVVTGSDEYTRVVKGIHETLPIPIDYIERIQNPYTWGCYLLKKEEYKSRLGYFKELTLYHETLESNVLSIARNNFDWRRCSHRAKYGEGVNFSYSARYAHMNSSNAGDMIVARVMVGKTEPGDWNVEIPKEGNDTTTSDGGANCCNVYVKFSDHEFYPEYVVHFPKRRS